MPCYHNLEPYLQDYIEIAGQAGDREGPLFRTRPLAHWCSNRFAVGLNLTPGACFSVARGTPGFRPLSAITPSRATGITAYLDNRGSLENAQAMAAHESPRTTKALRSHRRRDNAR
jgi:hypothetical protein